MRTRVLGAYALLVFGLVWATSGVAAQQQQMTFTAQLTGDHQVPPVDTSAAGTATFTLIAQDRLAYTLEITSPTSSAIQFAHIHLGPPGANGGVIVNLCGTSDTPACAQGGMIAQGVITPDNFVGHLAGRPMADLLTFMDEGNTYVNVHTQNFPSGEIRGQIEPATRHSHDINHNHNGNVDDNSADVDNHNGHNDDHQSDHHQDQHSDQELD